MEQEISILKRQADDEEPAKTTERNGHRGTGEQGEESQSGSCWGGVWDKSKGGRSTDHYTVPRRQHITAEKYPVNWKI